MVVRYALAESVSIADQERFDFVFQALSDPTRRDIVRRVLHEAQSVSDLARRYPMSFAAVQKHVAVLERASLVTKRTAGRERMVSGRIGAVRDVAQLFDLFETTWRGRLDRFGDVLDEVKPKSDEKPPRTTTKQGVKR